MTDMDKLCEGCLAHERVGTVSKKECYNLCPGYRINDIDCPCQHCLIKMMCNTVCNLMRER